MNRVLEFLKMFIKNFVKEIKKDDLFSVANNLTYKIFFSLFPFIIFLISLVGFLELDETYLAEQFYSVVPDDIESMIQTFIDEVIYTKNPNILSFSLFLSIWSASWGFDTVIKSINKAYGEKDTRSIVRKVLINMASVVGFAFIIVISFVMLIFGDHIMQFIQRHFEINEAVILAAEFLRYILAVSAVFFAVLMINKVSISKKVTWKSLVPGSAMTVVLWIVVSKLFNIYVKNFSRYSKVYGSLAGIIIFLLWLNIICIVFIFGCAANAVSSQISTKDNNIKINNKV